MSAHNRRDFLKWSTAAATLGWLGDSADGLFAKEPVPGVETIVTPLISGEEFNRQPGIWALEVRFKPIRLLLVDLPDPKSPDKITRQLVWYLAYRAINRAGETQARPSSIPDEKPIFVPEFTLVTNDNGVQKRYYDRVIPVAQTAINRRERHNYKSSVELVGDLPQASPASGKIVQSLDGVAIWRGIDPKADRYTVYMTGFSNGYLVGKLPNGEEAVQRKTIEQKFWRPGDEFVQHEEEIRLEGDPRWMYR